MQTFIIDNVFNTHVKEEVVSALENYLEILKKDDGEFKTYYLEVVIAATNDEEWDDWEEEDISPLADDLVDDFEDDDDWEDDITRDSDLNNPKDKIGGL